MPVSKWRKEQVEKWIPETQVVYRVGLNTGGLVHTGEKKYYQQRMQDCRFGKSSGGNGLCELSDH